MPRHHGHVGFLAQIGQPVEDDPGGGETKDHERQHHELKNQPEQSAEHGERLSENSVQAPVEIVQTRHHPEYPSHPASYRSGIDRSIALARLNQTASRLRWNLVA